MVAGANGPLSPQGSGQRLLAVWLRVVVAVEWRALGVVVSLIHWRKLANRFRLPPAPVTIAYIASALLAKDGKKRVCFPTVILFMRQRS